MTGSRTIRSSRAWWVRATTSDINSPPPGAAIIAGIDATTPDPPDFLLQSGEFVEAIAIGNGTASRETEKFVKASGLPDRIQVVMANGVMANNPVKKCLRTNLSKEPSPQIAGTDGGQSCKRRPNLRRMDSSDK